MKLGEINIRRGDFNEYKIIEDYVIIYLTNRSGDKLECLIDLEDLDRVKQLGFLHANYHPDIDNYYVKTYEISIGEDGKRKYKGLYLHRIIMNAEKDDEVDHLFHETLDNRKKYLKLTKGIQNTKNRKGANTNNKSGYRNVFWSNSEQKWVVSLCINYHRFRCGSFDDVHEAGRHAEEMRKKYYTLK